MLNQVILVGRVKKLDKLAGIVSIDIKRPNEKDSDLIPVNLSEGIMDNVMEYLSENSTIGVKASLHIDDNILRIVGEKVTFINAKNNLPQKMRSFFVVYGIIEPEGDDS